MSDIQRSYDLLATAKASYYLGITAQKRDQLQRAEGYLSAAANASGDVGERARRALSSLRLSTAPERFFKVDLGVNERGLLRVRLRNTSQAVLRAMQLRVIDLHRSAAAEVILPVNIVLSARRQWGARNGDWAGFWTAVIRPFPSRGCDG